VARCGGKWCRCHAHDVEYSGVVFRCVYDKKYKVIRTVLYPETLNDRPRPKWRNKWGIAAQL
jgi:hypothetical protein